ncbi:MAG TPA: hypothetical protein PKG86_01080 [Bacteroidales bacterium]|nr:hypothetical protein [Bacteroidales bacterium]
MEKPEPKPTTNGDNKKNRIFKWILIAGFSIFFIFVLYYFIMISLAARKWVSDFNKNYKTALLQSDSSSLQFITDSTFRTLHQQIAFTKARLDLTKANPLGLSIDLSDSSAKLIIHGVTVHSSKIRQVKIARSLLAVEPYYLSLELSKPLKVKTEVSSIPKEPIQIITAPKDTIEAAQISAIPDTTTTCSTFYKIIFENNLTLFVFQKPKTNKLFDLQWISFLYKARAPQVKANIVSILKFKIPEYSPEILIGLPEWEAKTIYRALPKEGLVALRLY